jgi:cellobiose transport system substrate-binding protein
VLGVLAAQARPAQPKTVLRIAVFGDFGYRDLYARFERAHPGVKIKEEVRGYGGHHALLLKQLEAGTGAADVEAIEVGYIARVDAVPQQFVDLRRHGAAKLRRSYLPWKWDQAVAQNGAVIGLGTDVGGLGMCYRRDDFSRAGLPTDREAVARLWPTWERYIALGRRFQAHAPNGIHFFDSGTSVFSAIVAQANPAYYDADGTLVAATNPTLKAAWDTTMGAIRAGESAAFGSFSTDWNAGFASGIFATIPCPAWMMGYIQDEAPKSGGKWDIAAPPGHGGNSGGSFLTVPRQSLHPALAAALVKFLTSPASELYVFKQTGNLPSLSSVLRRPEVQRLRSRYFHDAPVGKIFAASVLELRPRPLGPHEGEVENAASSAIMRVERSKTSSAASWAQFLRDVRAFR